MPYNFLTKFKSTVEKLCRENRSVISTFWVSIATHSFRVKVHEMQDPQWIRENRPDGFEFKYLTINLRCPGNVLKLHRELERIVGDGHVDTLSAAVSPGPPPLLYRVPSCSCGGRGSARDEDPGTVFAVATEDSNLRGNGGTPLIVCDEPPAEVHPLNCGCSEERMTATLGALFQKIGVIDGDGKVAAESTWPGKITIILFAVADVDLEYEMLHLLEQSCRGLGLNVEDRSYIISSPSTVDPSDESDNPRPADCDAGPTGNDTLKVPPNDEGSSMKRSLSSSSSNSCDTDILFRRGDESSDSLPRDDPKTVILTTETSFIGCESTVVICVEPNGMLHWYPGSLVAFTTCGVSRCLSQYIHLTLGESEAEVMFDRQRDHLGQPKQNDLRGAGRQSCIQRLIKAQVITEESVKLSAEVAPNSRDG